MVEFYSPKELRNEGIALPLDTCLAVSPEGTGLSHLAPGFLNSFIIGDSVTSPFVDG